MTYYVHETSAYFGVDLSTIGITVDNSITPKALLVDTTIAAQTLYLEWWAEPSEAQDTIIYHSFTLEIAAACDATTLAMGTPQHAFQSYTFEGGSGVQTFTFAPAEYDTALCPVPDVSVEI